MCATSGTSSTGGYIIILSALGGILSYGTLVYNAEATGVFSQPFNQIAVFLFGLGPGLAASLLSLLAYVKR